MPARREHFGHKGISRCTIYERPDATSIYIEWFDDDGRHREALSKVVGHPVTDWEVARECARRLSSAQERKRNQQASVALGIPTERTLKELLDQRHDDLAPTWTDKYQKSRDRRRTFWLDKLGDIRLTALNAAVVERIARDAQGDKSDRWRQDVLRYLVDSLAYAERKLKWIEPRFNLSNVDIPRARGRSVAYSLEDAQKLIPALGKVHPIAGWIGVVCFQTGRRLGAVRTLKPAHVSLHEDHTVLHFPRNTDKARNTGQAVVYGLPERTDWTVPTAELCNDWIHEAEKLAGIPHVDGRGWHGLKRLYATLTEGMQGADLQSGTRRETLSGHYRQDVLAPKAEVARELSRHCPVPNGASP